MRMPNVIYRLMLRHAPCHGERSSVQRRMLSVWLAACAFAQWFIFTESALYGGSRLVVLIHNVWESGGESHERAERAAHTEMLYVIFVYAA